MNRINDLRRIAAASNYDLVPMWFQDTAKPRKGSPNVT